MENENTTVIAEEDNIFLEEEDVKEEAFTDTENTDILEDSASENDEDPTLRDFAAEIRELWEIRPDLKGKPLPPEVAQAAAQGQRLSLAYFAFDAKAARTQAESRRKENDILRQNAASAARAPVKGAAGGTGEAGARDPFLEGFETQW